MASNAQGRQSTKGSAPVSSSYFDSPEKTICQKIRDQIDDAMPYWGPVREGMDKQEAFLDGERYEDDHGAYNLDRRLIQIKGNEIQDTVRHIAARATERPRSLEPRPVDEEPDATNGEIAVGLVERELGDPWKGYNAREYAAIISCREKQLGVVLMDYDPDFGAYGEIFYRYVDCRKVMWDPAYESPHDPLCGWFLEERRVDVEWLKRNYPDCADWIKPDHEQMTPADQLRPGVPVMRDGIGGTLKPGRYRDNKVTTWWCWYKNDQTRAVEENAAQDQPIPDGERYMVCRDGCGYRSPTQDAIQQDGYPDYQMPEEAICPTCEQAGKPGMLERIDSKAQPWEVLAFAKGKRLVIFTPFLQSPDDDPVYDGDWPIPAARSYPGFFITHSVKPGRPVGYSDTILMWDQQVASDNLATAAVERVLEHRNYWVLPADGIDDYKGQRFTFRDDQFNVMFRRATATGPLNIEMLNGSGLDPMFPFAFNMAQQKLVQYRGMNDLGPIEDRAKAKSGVALQTENAIGEIPVEDFNRRKNDERSKFAGVVWDYIRATYTPERLARLRMNGIDLVAGLQGDELPNYDFVIEDTPAFSGLEKARSEAWDSGMAMIQQAAALPPNVQQKIVEAWGRWHNVPKSIVRDLQEVMQGLAQQLQQQQAQTQQMQMDGGAMGTAGAQALPGAGSVTGPSPAASMNAGPNGGGMVPQPIG